MAAQLFLLTGYGIGREALMDAESLEVSMRAIVSIVEMHMVTEPLVFCGRKGSQWGEGISILIGIEESHLSLHALADEGKFYFELFSCKPFDGLGLASLIKLFFDPVECRWQMIDMEDVGDG